MKHSSTILVTEFVTHVVSLIGFRAYLGRLPQELLGFRLLEGYGVDKMCPEQEHPQSFEEAIKCVNV